MIRGLLRLLFGRCGCGVLVALIAVLFVASDAKAIGRRGGMMNCNVQLIPQPVQAQPANLSQITAPRVFSPLDLPVQGPALVRTKTGIPLSSLATLNKAPVGAGALNASQVAAK